MTGVRAHVHILVLISKDLERLTRGCCSVITGTLPSAWATIKTVRYRAKQIGNGTFRWVDAEKRSLDGLHLAYNELAGCAPNPLLQRQPACTDGSCNRPWLQS